MQQDTARHEAKIHLRAAAQILAMAARRVVADRAEGSLSLHSQGQFDEPAHKLSTTRERAELALPVGPRRGLMSDDRAGACCPRKETPKP